MNNERELNGPKEQHEDSTVRGVEHEAIGALILLHLFAEPGMELEGLAVALDVCLGCLRNLLFEMADRPAPLVEIEWDDDGFHLFLTSRGEKIAAVVVALTEFHAGTTSEDGLGSNDPSVN